MFINITASNTYGKEFELSDFNFKYFISINDEPFSERTSPDTSLILPDTSSFYTVQIKVQDEFGNIAETLKREIRVLADPPRIFLTVPDSVQTDSTFEIYFTANSGWNTNFGSITKKELSIGSYDNFMTFNSDDTTLVAPTQILDDYPIVARVTDDDNNITIDTMTIDFFGRWDSLWTTDNISSNYFAQDYSIIFHPGHFYL